MHKVKFLKCILAYDSHQCDIKIDDCIRGCILHKLTKNATQKLIVLKLKDKFWAKYTNFFNVFFCVLLHILQILKTQQKHCLKRC